MILRKTTKIFLMVMLCSYSYTLFYINKIIQKQPNNLSIFQHYFNDRYFRQSDELQKQITLKLSTSCKEKQNLVFIKCMKCATETMATVIRRFGYTRNLSFVLPIGTHIYLGWPYLMEKIDYRPPFCKNCSTAYNILMEHAIYNRSIMRSLMPKDTVYISIIREPYDRFLSTFHYFKIKDYVVLNETDYVSQYLNNYHKYEAIYKSKTFSEHYCIPRNFSLTENLMAHCLGVPLGFPAGRKSIASYSTGEITRYLQDLDNDFSLVMIVEYFDESLILLRRLMCWKMKDIIFRRVNIGGYRKTNASNNRQTEQNRQLYKSYSRIDYILYNYFKRVLLEKIKQQTPDFFDEVNHFRKVESEVTEFCDNFYLNKSTKKFISVNQTSWNNAFNYTDEDSSSLLTQLSILSYTASTNINITLISNTATIITTITPPIINIYVVTAVAAAAAITATTISSHTELGSNNSGRIFLSLITTPKRGQFVTETGFGCDSRQPTVDSRQPTADSRQ
eukprot:XP_014776046.1 PREDICTED: galactose-3-O-sulfotransferase 2-like [Octopus bimaculoides]